MTAFKEVQRLKDHQLKVQKSNVSLSKRLLSTWDTLLIHPSANHITKETFNVCWYNLIQAGSLGVDDIKELQEIQEFDRCFNVVVQEKECSARLMWKGVTLLLQKKLKSIYQIRQNCICSLYWVDNSFRWGSIIIGC